MDYQVKAVQEWLLKRYSGKPEFDAFVQKNNFRANGSTGNNTMYALRMALQYELNIPGPTGNFGPGTLAQTPTVSKDKLPKNRTIVKILEGAMWCHGYNPGGVFEADQPGDITSTMNAGLQHFVNDVGFQGSFINDVEVTPYLWKALLSTDAFTTTWTNGNMQLRSIQMLLNTKVINGYRLAPDYLGRYIPTDGLGGRDFSNLLIYYLQALMGLVPNDATGNFGPATQNSLPVISNDNVREDYLTILRAGLILNNVYDVHIYSTWSELKNAIITFQKNRAIPVTGIVDKATWMALLISYGDQNRSPNACDTRFEITESKADYLLSKGIQYVGRYLTGGDWKELRQGEAQRLKSKGLTVFPIYQDAGKTTQISYYTRSQGVESAIKAEQAAMNFGFPAGTTIYFAVDLDTYGWQIDEYIIPYFQSISNNIGNYNVGIYATRLGCSKVMEAGAAQEAFVANMSSGWSGNLGFPMPRNWTFEQYVEYSNLSSDEGSWDLDYCIYSGANKVLSVGDDPRAKTLQQVKENMLLDFVVNSGEILNIPQIFQLKAGLFKLDQEITVAEIAFAKFKVKASLDTFGSIGDGMISLDGEFDRKTIKASLEADLTGGGFSLDTEMKKNINGHIDSIEKLTKTVTTGSISYELDKDSVLPRIIITLVSKDVVVQNSITTNFKVQYIIELHPSSSPSGEQEHNFDWQQAALYTAYAAGIVAVIAGTIVLAPAVIGAGAAISTAFTTLSASMAAGATAFAVWLGGLFQYLGVTFSTPFLS